MVQSKKLERRGEGRQNEYGKDEWGNRDNTCGSVELCSLVNLSKCISFLYSSTFEEFAKLDEIRYFRGKFITSGHPDLKKKIGSKIIYVNVIRKFVKLLFS